MILLPRVAAFVCFGLLIVSCDSPVKTSNQSLEEAKFEASQLKEASEPSDDSEPATDTGETGFESAEQELLHLVADLRTASEAEKAATEELQRLRAELESAKNWHRVTIRKRAQGRHLGNLVLASGTTLQKAAIREVDDQGIKISHAAGVGAFPFSDFPKEIQNEFAYDPAAAAKRAEAEAEAARQAAIRLESARIARAAEVQRKEQEKQAAAFQADRKKAEDAKAIARLHDEISSAKKRIKAITNEISERKQKQFDAEELGRIASHTAPVKQLSYEKQRLEKAIARAEGEIATLQSGG